MTLAMIEPDVFPNRDLLLKSVSTSDSGRAVSSWTVYLIDWRCLPASPEFDIWQPEEEEEVVQLRSCVVTSDLATTETDTDVSYTRH